MGNLLGRDYASFIVGFFQLLKDLGLCDFKHLEARAMKRIFVHKLHIFREVLKDNWRLGHMFFDSFLSAAKTEICKVGKFKFVLLRTHVAWMRYKR